MGSNGTPPIPRPTPRCSAYAAGSEGRSAFPKVRVVTISECGSHAMIDAAIGERGQAKAGSEQALARLLYPRAEGDWLLIADRNFYNFTDWQAAQASGTQLLWRAKSNLRLPQLRHSVMAPTYQC